MLPGNLRTIGAWQSAQTLFPTKVAPGISSGARTALPVVEQELRMKTKKENEPSKRKKRT